MNWRNWIYGACIAILTAVMTGLAAWGTLPDNVTTKQIVIICILPALGVFLAWLKQTPPPGPALRMIVGFALMVALSGGMGCAAVSGPLVKVSHENYVANKKLAIEALTQCSGNIGFLDGLGLMDKVKFPINTTSELRPIIKSPAAVLGLIELRELCENKEQKPDGSKYWSDEEYNAFYVLGAEVRMGVQSAIDIAKLLFPDFMAAYLKFL